MGDDVGCVSTCVIYMVSVVPRVCGGGDVFGRANCRGLLDVGTGIDCAQDAEPR